MKISQLMQKIARFCGIGLCVLLAVSIMVLALTSCKDPRQDSPAYEVMALLKEEKYVHAANLYNEKISGNAEEERLMEVLLAKQAEWKQKLIVCVRDEAGKAMTDATMTCWNKWTRVAEALEYLPEDETLLAWQTSLVEPMKQEFYKELRGHMGDLAMNYMDRIDGLQRRLPDDPEVQQLYDAALRYQWRGLHLFLGDKQNISHLYYPRRLPVDDPTGYPLFANDPIADRHGVKHDPFNLYRVTASVNDPASFRSREWNKGDGLKQLTFTADAAVGCGNGSAVIEVYTVNGNTRTKIYTSPVLNRNTKNLKVDVDLGGVAEIEVCMVATRGSVTMLWDHAYLDYVKPAM